MSSERKHSIVAGSTGLVGAEVVRQLLNRADTERVIALARRPLPEAPKLATQLVDYTSLSPAAFAGCDEVFCCLGTTIAKAGSKQRFREVDATYVHALATAARAAGVRNFSLISAVGADAGSGNFYLRVKAEAEQHVRSAGFERVQILRPSLLLGDRAEKRPGERIAMAIMPRTAALLFGPLRKYRAISADQVARAMVSAARSAPDGTHVYEYDDLRRFAAEAG